MRYRIVCAEQTGCQASGHIVAVGVGSDPQHAADRLTVAQVWAAMDGGDTFYTEDRFGRQAEVQKYHCRCRGGSLRSSSDASRENNLDSLRICSWRAA